MPFLAILIEQTELSVSVGQIAIEDERSMKIDRIGFERRRREGSINKHIESSTTSNTTDMAARSVTSNRNQFIRNNLLLIRGWVCDGRLIDRCQRSEVLELLNHLRG